MYLDSILKFLQVGKAAIASLLFRVYGNLTDGSYTFRVVALASANDPGPASSFYFTVDSTPPSVMNFSYVLRYCVCLTPRTSRDQSDSWVGLVLAFLPSYVRCNQEKMASAQSFRHTRNVNEALLCMLLSCRSGNNAGQQLAPILDASNASTVVVPAYTAFSIAFNASDGTLGSGILAKRGCKHSSAQPPQLSSPTNLTSGKICMSFLNL